MKQCVCRVCRYVFVYEYIMCIRVYDADNDDDMLHCFFLFVCVKRERNKIWLNQPKN